jgi:hypothetical protein
MSRRVFLNPVTPNTKNQNVRCGYAGMIMDILTPVHGYTCISQGYDIIEKDISCLVHRYASFDTGYEIIRYMPDLGQTQNNDEINHIYLEYIQGCTVS